MTTCPFHGYEVTSSGEVFSPEGQVKPYIRGKYLFVRLKYEGKLHDVRLHSLVAQLFLGLKRAYQKISFKDGNTFNVVSSNLQYINKVRFK